LGNTMAQIAGEKGGIIKDGVPVVTGVKQNRVIDVLKTIAREKSAPFYRLGEAFRIRRHTGEDFSYYGLDHTWPHLRTGLLGHHQADNAALVLAACELLKREQVELTPLQIHNGLLENKWPGRMEIVSKTPTVLLDGAHNLSAVQTLARYLSTRFTNRHITLVTGILDDKAYPAMLRKLLPLCTRAIFTRPKIDRALPPEKFLAVAKDYLSDALVISDVPSAVAHAVNTSSENDIICVTGSLYLVGEVKEALETGKLKL
jgi:dihydrofolate synthase / folylpolyglutamate synthase